jgi:hypothetical protein
VKRRAFVKTRGSEGGMVVWCGAMGRGGEVHVGAILSD